jgi:hypothetical protein
MMIDCLTIILRDVSDLIFGRPASPPAQSDVSDRQLEQLLAALRTRRQGLTLVDAAVTAFEDLGEIPRLLHWNQGLREALHDLILQSVHQAERFGDGSGELKRRFAVDLVTRVLRPYDPTGLIQPVEDVLVAPFVGIVIDWSVTVLNIHKAWKPIEHVKLPGLFAGRYGRALRLGACLYRRWMALRELLFAPSRYERQIRSARRSIDPQARELTAALPPASMPATVELLVNVVVRIGNLTAPHVRTVDALLRLAHQILDMSAAERRDTVLRAVTILLRETYAGSAAAQMILNSSIGQSMLEEMINTTDWILTQNGLLPQTGSSSRNPDSP